MNSPRGLFSLGFFRHPPTSVLFSSFLPPPLTRYPFAKKTSAKKTKRSLPLSLPPAATPPLDPPPPAATSLFPSFSHSIVAAPPPAPPPRGYRGAGIDIREESPIAAAEIPCLSTDPSRSPLRPSTWIESRNLPPLCLCWCSTEDEGGSSQRFPVVLGGGDG